MRGRIEEAGRLTPLLTPLLVIWSVLVRVVVGRSDSVAAFYFPDSWNYVVLPSTGQAHPFHGPFIYSVWDFLSIGAPTEAGVVLMQQAFGLVAVVLVWTALRRLVAEPIAFGASLLFAAQPLTLFFERTILTEAVSVVIVAALLFLVTQLLVNDRPVADAMSLAALGLLSGVLVALRPASRLVVLAPLVVALFIVVSRYWSRRNGSRNTLVGLGLIALLVITILPAPLHVRSVNNDQFGTASLTPGAGTAVLAWWGWRLDCEPHVDYTERAQQALAASCDQSEPEEQLMWVPGAVSRSMDPHGDFAATQAQLTAEAQAAILASPTYVAGRVVSKSWTHAFSPVVNLERYSNGAHWFAEGAVALFPGHDEWFDGSSDRTRLASDPAIFTLVRQSSRLPGVLALLLVVSVLVAAVRSIVRARSLGDLRAAVENPRTQTKGLIVLTAAAMVLANELVVALGGLPIFRYWVPVLPALFIGLAVVVDSLLGRGSATLTSEDG